MSKGKHGMSNPGYPAKNMKTTFGKNETTSDVAKYTGSGTADRTSNAPHEYRHQYDMAPYSRHMNTKRVLTDTADKNAFGATNVVKASGGNIGDKAGK